MYGFNTIIHKAKDWFFNLSMDEQATVVTHLNELSNQPQPVVCQLVISSDNKLVLLPIATNDIVQTEQYRQRLKLGLGTPSLLVLVNQQFNIN